MSKDDLTEDDTFRVLKRVPFSEADPWVRRNITIYGTPGTISVFDTKAVNKALEWTGWTWDELAEYHRKITYD